MFVLHYRRNIRLKNNVKNKLNRKFIIINGTYTRNYLIRFVKIKIKRYFITKYRLK